MKIKNVFFSSLGVTVPAALFILCTPFVISNFGLERFGYITIFWICLSVSSVLDFGVSRALTNYVASENQNDQMIVSNVIYSVLLCLFVISTIISLFFYFSAIEALNYLDNIPPDLKIELKESLFWVALAIPMVVIYSALRGVYEGLANFKLTSQVKIAIGIIMVLPLAFIQGEFGTLQSAALIAMASRLFGVIFLTIKYLYDFKPNFFTFEKSATSVFSYGGKIFVSTFSSSILVYLDRFVASYFLSPVEFGFYSLCTELIMRFLFIPGAISSVSFQSISKFRSNSDYLYVINKAIKLLIISVIPLAIIFIFFGSDIILVWTGQDIPKEFEFVILILTLGFVFNSFAHVPYAFLQANKKAAFTAKLHLVELLVFSILIWLAVSQFGIVGMLLCWLFRLILDALFLTWKAKACF